MISASAPRAATDRELLRGVADSLLDLPYSTWSFGDSVAFEGMLAASAVLGDERWTTFARGMFRGWATRAEPFVRLDCTAPGLAMVEVYERTGDTLILDAAVRLAEYLRGRPTMDGVFATWDESPLKHPYGPAQLPPDEVRLLVSPPPGVFVDCLHFDPPFLTALGRATGSADLLDAGVEQALGYVRLLQHAETGLFFHFVLADQPRPYALGWGRGQGWALLGLLDVIERVPPSHPGRARLADAARALIRAMLTAQRPDGGWYTVVQDPSSGDESSTAPFMIDGLFRAAALGLVERGDVADAVDRAAASMRSNLDGSLLRGVSAAVWACTQLSHYSFVPRDHIVPWGQGPLALALCTLVAEHT